MPTTIPALRGKFGDTEYWLTTIHVGELVQKILIPNELQGWETINLEEKWQRDVNLHRIKKYIAPYFANEPNRFTGALVLAIFNGDNVEFEPLGKFGGSGVPQLYRSASRDLGFLTLDGGEMLVPIDGQHRAKAFKYAMTGVDDAGNPIDGVTGNPALAEDDVAVILLRFNQAKARQIFSKINRYAKPTSASDNYITDDDDAIAVISRWLCSENGILPPRLVRIGSNTLPEKAAEFTTLATLYAANLATIERLPGTGKPQSMNEAQQFVAADGTRNVWDTLFNRIDLFERALRDATVNGDSVRIQIRKETLLGKPIGQLALVRAFLEMRERCVSVSDAAICERLNRIDWSVDNEQWVGVLMQQVSGRVLFGKTFVNNACLFIAYLAGAPFSETELAMLRRQVGGTDDSYQLPTPIA